MVGLSTGEGTDIPPTQGTIVKLHRCGRDAKATWLRSIPGFDQFSSREIAALASTADRVSVPGGRRLTIQGQRGQECFIVASGHVEVRRDGRHVARLGPGDVVGELALLDEAPRTADAVAATDVELIVFDVRGFRTALSSHRRFRQLIEAAAMAHR